MHTTSRLALDVPDNTDNVSSFPTVNAQAMGVLDNSVMFLSGTLASRPSASLDGRIYHATDIGVYYLDTGSAWVPLGSASGSTATGLTFTPNTTTSYTNIASSGVTITCTGRPVVATAGPIVVYMGSAPAYGCYFGFSVDGGAASFAGSLLVATSADEGLYRTITPMAVLSPSVGSHTITLQQKLDSSGSGVAFSSGNYVGQIAVYQT